MLGCIPEILLLLLTPIYKYICMSNARCHACHICPNDIYDKYHIHHIMAVCMSIWVSKEALRPKTISKLINKCFRAYPVTWFVLCIFRISFKYFRPIQNFTNILQMQLINLNLVLFYLFNWITKTDGRDKKEVIKYF